MKIQKFDLLVSIYITCLLLSEIMGVKTFPLINLFGYQFNASVAILTFPILFTINDVIIEVYGKERVRSVIRSGFLMVIFFTVFSVFATQIEPSSRFASSESQYDYIFNQSIRMSIASLIAFATSEFLDVLVFVRVKNMFGEKRLWLRNNLSNFTAQLFDTTIFMTLAFYSLNDSVASNFDFLIGIILPYWFLKCSMSVIETPLLYVGIRWLKK